MALYDRILNAYRQAGVRQGRHEREMAMAEVTSWPTQWMRLGFEVRSFSGQDADACQRLIDQLESDRAFALKQFEPTIFYEELREAEDQRLADEERRYRENDPFRQSQARREAERREQIEAQWERQRAEIDSKGRIIASRQATFWDAQKKWRDSSGWPGS